MHETTEQTKNRMYQYHLNEIKGYIRYRDSAEAIPISQSLLHDVFTKLWKTAEHEIDDDFLFQRLRVEVKAELQAIANRQIQQILPATPPPPAPPIRRNSQ